MESNWNWLQFAQFGFLRIFGKRSNIINKQTGFKGPSIYDVQTKIGFLTPPPSFTHPHEPDPLVDVHTPFEKMTSSRKFFGFLVSGRQIFYAGISSAKISDDLF